ncbi:uncharacterized protein BP5553_10497 [Venustampulla echinocandica]|uniref:Uncharacterized protein n=1 Tax=Venustampulla echinocandica TaxID=2656787 RepID=A0A370T9I8_9HELO|nr:uncharacterized protein BP5553_10497 [Venustampulla echinocandica]RDL30219.1 hypothetical protein BP5553_10497 [Venustampulla echinocandica]
MDSIIGMRGWDEIAYLTEDPAQCWGSSFDGYQPATFNMPSYRPYPASESLATPLQHQHSYLQDQRQEQGFATNNLDVTLQQEALQPQGPEIGPRYVEYRTAMKEIFQNIIDGRLAMASQSLLEESKWLAGHVEVLGLTVDDVSVYTDMIGNNIAPAKAVYTERKELWDEFNTAWVSLFQKQSDMQEPGQRIQHRQSLMSEESVNEMAEGLTEMCDAIEKHGLVDYQYGVEEERIVVVIENCLDLQESRKGMAEGRGLENSP